MDCSFYGRHENVALHTDLCSPVATDPTWTGLNDAQRAALMRRGVPLWRRLVDELAPDLIIASVARAHLTKIEFSPRSPWQVMHTVSGPTRTRPYLVEVRKLALTSGKSTALVMYFAHARSVQNGRSNLALRELCRTMFAVFVAQRR